MGRHLRLRWAARGRDDPPDPTPLTELIAHPSGQETPGGTVTAVIVACHRHGLLRIPGTDNREQGSEGKIGNPCRDWAAVPDATSRIAEPSDRVARVVTWPWLRPIEGGPLPPRPDIADFSGAVARTAPVNLRGFPPSAAWNSASVSNPGLLLQFAGLPQLLEHVVGGRRGGLGVVIALPIYFDGGVAGGFSR
jgi:hypothetical protein